MTQPLSSQLKCPLCGFEFDARDLPCHDGCPMHKACKLVCCPSCRYEFPEPSTTLAFFHRLFRRKPRPPAPAGLTRLSDLDEGETGEMASVATSHGETRRNSLAVYGLVPGSRVLLQQKHPAIIVRIGETELALDQAIAQDVYVKRGPATTDC